jgi:PAS domain S-box-containing protein
MDKFLVLPKGPLVRKLAFYIILFSSVIAISITTSELSYEYFRDLRQIDDRMEQIRSAYLDSMTENVWVADKERIDTLLQGITRLPDFVLAEVRINGKTEFRRGSSLAGMGVKQSFPLQRMHQGRLQDIGELLVEASYQGANKRVLDRALFFLLSNGAKTLLVALFIFAIYYRLVGRHLGKMARYAQENASSEDAAPLVLRRPAPAKADELSSLVGAINFMRGELVKLNREQKERLRIFEEQSALLELTHDAMIGRDLSGVIIFWSRSAQATYGWPKGLVLGKRVQDLFETNYSLPLNKIEEILFRTGYWEGQLAHTTQSGQRIVVASRWAVKRDAQGSPVSVLEINRRLS